MEKSIRKIYLSIFSFLFVLIAAAQEKKVDVDINVDKGQSWYMQPWVWVVGAAIFILLLIGMLKTSKEK